MKRKALENWIFFFSLILSCSWKMKLDLLLKEELPQFLCPN